MKTKKNLIIHLALIMCVCTFTACSSLEYNKALKLMENGNYEEAKAIFIELGDYKESTSKINYCKKGIANDYLKSGAYKSAIPIFIELEDYKSVTECNWGIVLDYYSNNSSNINDELKITVTPNCDGLIIEYNSTYFGVKYTIEKNNNNFILEGLDEGRVADTANMDLKSLKLSNLNWNDNYDWGDDWAGVLLNDVFSKRRKNWEMLFLLSYLNFDDEIKSNCNVYTWDLGINLMATE